MMFAEERKLKILEFIEEYKKATVSQLCEHFTVSSATIRNDLRDLESANLLIRTHGGAMAKSKIGFELDSSQKKVRNLDKKQKIAEAAINLIEDGDTIILDTGTTTIELAKLLHRKRDITVVTNDLGITLLLEDVDSVNIVLMGGIVRKHFHCTVTYGTTGKDTLSGLNVDNAFMGVNSFCMKKGAMTPDICQAETKKLMISIAANVILLCHSTKFGNTSFAQFATLDQIDTIITENIDAKDFRKLEDSGIDVIVAS